MSAPTSKKAQDAVNSHIKLPAGYSIVWSGQYEYMEKTRERLLVIIPLTILIIFVLIYASTTLGIKTGIVFLAVPFSLVGAFWLPTCSTTTSRSPSGSGVIALAGLDAETGVVMLLYLDLAHKLWGDQGRMQTRGDLVQAIHHGAVQAHPSQDHDDLRHHRRPAADHVEPGTGADVMKRIAAPMVGGVVTSALMELLVYPVIFFLWRGRDS